MAEKALYYPWFPRDFLADEAVLPMTLSEEGAYRRLLDHQWLHGSIPADLGAMSGICKNVPPREMKKIWTRVSVCFVEMPDDPTRLYNRRLERQREEVQRRSKKMADNGRSGGHAKWGTPLDQENRLIRSERLAAARKLGLHTREEWEAMKAVFGAKCLRCGRGEPDVRIVKDHITPIYRGGSDAITNIQPLCQSCNSTKGSDETDWRAGRAACLAKWLPNARQMPSGTPSNGQANDYRTPTIKANTKTTPPVRAREVGPELRGKLVEPHNVAIVERFLSAAPTDQRALSLEAKLRTWLSGHDWPPGPKLTPNAAASGLAEYLDEPGDFSAAHVLAFLLRTVRQWHKHSEQLASGAAEVPAKAQQEAQALWVELKRSGVLYAGTTEEWQEMVKSIAGTGVAKSIDHFTAIWREFDLPFLRAASTERAAVAHVAEAISRVKAVA